jgi:hypothetical protein
VFITAGPNTKLCAWGEEDSGGQSYFKRNHGSGVTSEASVFLVMERKVRSLFCGRVIHNPVLTQGDAEAQEPAVRTAWSRLQIALQRSAYIRLAARGAIRSGTRYTKWAGDSRSQTHRRSAMCGVTQDDGYVRGVAPTHERSSGSFLDFLLATLASPSDSRTQER